MAQKYGNIFLKELGYQTISCYGQQLPRGGKRYYDMLKPEVWGVRPRLNNYVTHDMDWWVALLKRRKKKRSNLGFPTQKRTTHRKPGALGSPMLHRRDVRTRTWSGASPWRSKLVHLGRLRRQNPRSRSARQSTSWQFHVPQIFSAAPKLRVQCFA